MEKITKFSPAYDRTEEGYGVGSMQCYMVLKGKHGAVHFVFLTQMHLPHVTEKWAADPNTTTKTLEVLLRPLGFDVGYHAKEPQYEGQTVSQEKCDWIGRPCYCDGSAVRADSWMKVLLEEGSDKIWSMLKEDYKEMFGELK